MDWNMDYEDKPEDQPEDQTEDQTEDQREDQTDTDYENQTEDQPEDQQPENQTEDETDSDYEDETYTCSDGSFDRHYLSYPHSHDSENHLEIGNKIIMPQSALDHLISLQVSYPMTFRIENVFTGHHSHCGVIEFTADEGFVFMPTWMMDNLRLRQGQLVNIKNTCLPKGTYIKIQPHVTKFITLSDHKTLLEKAFRDFACLTTGDTIAVNVEDETYMVNIVETKPNIGISLYETDCEVDFAPPLDYNNKEQPERKKVFLNKQKSGNKSEEKEDMKAFKGVGRRLNEVGAVPIMDDSCCESVDESNRNLKRLKVEDDVVKAEFKPLDEKAKRVDEPGSQVINVAEKDEGFKAFTGKSYRVRGGS
ncbi:uncharacterized protein [Rutidosis leptorrhynchoides]|uniref:uncharacterized protein n=1 Tax=Rutidosis leptorrhynchoides TaxID=125765 RepID=UPI003A997548